MKLIRGCLSSRGWGREARPPRSLHGRARAGCPRCLAAHLVRANEQPWDGSSSPALLCGRAAWDCTHLCRAGGLLGGSLSHPSPAGAPLASTAGGAALHAWSPILSRNIWRGSPRVTGGSPLNICSPQHSWKGTQRPAGGGSPSTAGRAPQLLWPTWGPEQGWGGRGVRAARGRLCRAESMGIAPCTQGVGGAGADLH